MVEEDRGFFSKSRKFHNEDNFYRFLQDFFVLTKYLSRSNGTLLLCSCKNISCN